MNGRICIRDIPGNVTDISNELKALIEKICPVVDVYLPSLTLTGIRRDFAIVTVNADIESIKKCVKVFNNCHWKGGKIKVDLAKEYYKDRLKREREEMNENNESVNDNEDDDISINNDVKDSTNSEIKFENVLPKDYITLKKVRSGKRMMIRTTPSLFPLKSKFQKVSISSVSTNAKTKNKKISNDDNIIIYNCGWKISFDDDGNPIKPDVSIEIDTNIVSDNVDKKDDVVINDGNNKISVAIKNLKEGGGGIRRGFGTLVSSSNDKKVVKSNIPEKQNNSDDCGCLPSLNGMPENEFIENNPYLSDDDVPCVSELELREENLAKERTRMNSLLLTVLGIESSPYANSGKVSINVNKIQGKTWGDVFIKRYDPTKEDSKRYEIDPSDKKGADDDNDEDEEEEGEEDDDDVEEEDDNNYDDDDKNNDDDDDNNNDDDNVIESSHGNSNSCYISSSTAIANTTALKDIFYKEDGGVWWGDDGTLKQTVGKGDAATDVIFREAEKLDDDTSYTQNNINQSNENNYEEIVFVNKNNNGNNDNEVIKVQSPMTLIDIVKNAKKFQRDKPVEELRQDWLDTRDKLKIDYKRKKKDDKKKKGLNTEHSPYNRSENNKIKIDAPSIRKIKSRRVVRKNKGKKGL